MIYHNAYCYQTCQSGDLLGEVPTLKPHDSLIKWSRDFDFFLYDL